MKEKISSQIKNIRQKIEKLKKHDPNYKAFGSETHKYQIRFNTLTVKEIKSFETRNKVELPEEYKAFLTNIGNGIAGPYYGLIPLVINKKYTNLNLPWIDTEEYNHELKIYKNRWDNFHKKETHTEKELEEADKWCFDKFDDKCNNGILQISHRGCNTYDILVVTGINKGKIFTDMSKNECEIIPANMNFLDWYEDWLDREIYNSKKNFNQTKQKAKIPNINIENTTNLSSIISIIKHYDNNKEYKVLLEKSIKIINQKWFKNSNEYSYHIDLYFYIFKAYEALNQTKNSEKALKTISDIYSIKYNEKISEDEYFIEQIASVYFELGKIDKAKEWLKKTDQINIEDFELKEKIYLLKGFCFEAEKQYNKAKEFYGKSYQLRKWIIPYQKINNL